MHISQLIGHISTIVIRFRRHFGSTASHVAARVRAVPTVCSPTASSTPARASNPRTNHAALPRPRSGTLLCSAVVPGSAVHGTILPASPVSSTNVLMATYAISAMIWVPADPVSICLALASVVCAACDELHFLLPTPCYIHPVDALDIVPSHPQTYLEIKPRDRVTPPKGMRGCHIASFTRHIHTMAAPTCRRACNYPATRISTAQRSQHPESAS